MASFQTPETEKSRDETGSSQRSTITYSYKVPRLLQTQCTVLSLISPAVSLLALLLIQLKVPVKVRPAASNGVGGAEANGRSADETAGGKLGPHALSPAEGQQRVQAGPGGREAGAGGGEAREVQVGGEEEGRREDGERHCL